MPRGPDIPCSGGGERDAFSRRYRRMRRNLAKAGEYAYWKNRYQRRSRRLAKINATRVARNPWQQHLQHLHPNELLQGAP